MSIIGTGSRIFFSVFPILFASMFFFIAFMTYPCGLFALRALGAIC